MRSDRGQGTVEYLAVVLLVAVVFGGTATVASGAGRDIASAVPREVIRALCIVRGGDCRRDIAPCDVTSSAKSKKWSVTIAVIKFGHDRTVTVTERSDGTYAVTLDTAPLGGVETSTGARGKVSLGKRSLSAGADITTSVVGSYAHGRTWILRSDEAARRLVAAIKADADLPAADLEGHEAKIEGGVSASAGSVATLSGGALGALGGGSQTDRKTGSKTYFFSAALAGDLGTSVQGTGAEASVSGAKDARFALTVGPDGRWVDLAISQTGALSGGADLPEQLTPVAKALDVPAKGARRWVTESHLDLTDAENLAAAQRVVAAVTDPLHPEKLSGSLTGLNARIRDNAVVDARTYMVDREATGIEGDLGLEIKAGGKYENSTENTRLVAATTRGIDGQWRVRDECLQEART
jgi:hypothetical protein